MSENIIRTIGHHTCKYCHPAYAKANAPFKSDPNNGDAYLGQGFYFWDDNIEYARHWGRVHYDNHYTILGYDFELSGDQFLDLVGSRKDISYFHRLYDDIRKREQCKDFGISKCIQILQIVEKEAPGVFPIKIIRAADYNINKKGGTVFVAGKRGFTRLNPCYIICFFDRNDISLQIAIIVDSVE